MNTRVQDLVTQASRLPPDDQAALLAALHDLIVIPDPGWEAAWVDESLDRLDGHRRGVLESVDSDEAMAVLRKKHDLP